MIDPYTWGMGMKERPRRFPASVLRLVEERMGGRFCEACGPDVKLPPGEPLEVDHKQPISDGGDSHHLNLRFLCRSHNRGRGNRRAVPDVPRWKRRRG